MNKTLLFLLIAFTAFCNPKTLNNSNYIERIIPTFNTLQEIISKANLANSLEFPQLVVVGAQSTGKSSVLEGIIRKDFLPRGTGIVTRTPIVIQMINTPESSAEYAMVGSKKILDWKLVKKEIETLTESQTDGAKGISTVPIHIQIFSPNVVNLNIVDLPGLTKIPVQGQPQDIGDKIYDMVMSYIQNPNSIILAVTPATIDLANSDSLKLARDVDPYGLRTIGVITKLDLMDKGTNYLPALKGLIHKLKLGYVGLVCRGQRDLEEGKSIAQAIQDEKKFFESHPDYKNYADEMGVEYLTKALSRIFLQHIKDNLPKLKTNIGLQIEDVKTRISQYGNPIYEAEKGVFILSVLNRFVEAYSQTIEGRDPFVYMETKLVGGARISLIFNEGFKNVVYRFDPFEGLTDDNIQTEIINSQALHPDIFITGSISAKLLKNQILKLQGVAIQCAKLVQKELQDIVHTILTDNQFSENFRFKDLNTQISKIINEVLKDALNETINAINILFKIEHGFINIKHPDFMRAMENLSTSVQNDNDHIKEPEQGEGIFSSIAKLWRKESKSSNTTTSAVCNRDTGECNEKAYLDPLPQNIYVKAKHQANHKNDIFIVKRFVNSYFDIVKKNLADSVPKAIVTFLVNESIETSKNKLMTEILSQSQKYDQLLKEDSSIVEKRKNYQEKLVILEKSEVLLLEMGSQLLIN